jgi:hypothetical protein
VLLLARAQFLAGDLAAAIATYEPLVRDHPDSPQRDRAAFQRAETFAANGRLAEAAAVYREQIARLTGAERKEQVAETYLGLADRALSVEPPDPGRVLRAADSSRDAGKSRMRWTRSTGRNRCEAASPVAPAPS